jgi:hypothetical protein
VYGGSHKDSFTTFEICTGIPDVYLNLELDAKHKNTAEKILEELFFILKVLTSYIHK